MGVRERSDEDRSWSWTRRAVVEYLPHALRRTARSWRAWGWVLASVLLLPLAGWVSDDWGFPPLLAAGALGLVLGVRSLFLISRLRRGRVWEYSRDLSVGPRAVVGRAVVVPDWSGRRTW